MEFKPTAGEIGNLWTFIIGNQAHLCLLENWSMHVEDEDVKAIIERSKEDATSIINQGLELFQKAGFPRPMGFSVEQDVIPNGPKLMSDELVLFTLQILSEYGIYGYGLALGKTSTPEVYSFIKNCLNRSTDLYQKITEQVGEKGYQHQAAYVPAPQRAEFVEHRSFLAGWWGEQRPVNAMEIDSLIYSLRGVILAKTMYMVFSKIAKDPDVQKFCQRGKDLTAKRVERLQSLNSTENLPFQETYESEIMAATNAAFSDRLIMYESVSLAQIAIARYGNALSSVIRRDISSMFALYIVETGTFLDDGAKIMIDKNWFEQPPMSADFKN